MTRKVFSVLALATIVILSAVGCERESGSAGTGTRIYYTASGLGIMRKLVDYEERAVSPKKLSVSGLFEELSNPPLNPGLRAAVPPGSAMERYSVEGGILTIKMSGEYLGLSGPERTLADCCIAMTMVQLDNIGGVCVESVQSGLRTSKVYYPSDFVLNDLKAETMERSLTLYFWDESEGAFTPEERTVMTRENEPLERYAVEELIKGSPNRNVMSGIPGGTRLLSAVTEEGKGICYVNLSGIFMNIADEVQAGAAVGSIVKTLCELPAISKVQIMIDGEKRDEFFGIDIGNPIGAEFGAGPIATESG